MIVTIAGYNVDNSLIDKQNSKTTPETISAAYARISRSKKSVTELRKEALSEVEKARKSNRKIVFDMGHSSIAEHVVFNIDIIGISRYLTEYVQKSRLASFTEKSQRYVTFDNKVVIPEEIKSQPVLCEEYTQLVAHLYSLYRELSIDIEKSFNRRDDSTDGVRQQDFSTAKDHDADFCTDNQQQKTAGSSAEISERAKEDARYILPLATETQMGMTINARNLESLLRRLAKVKLAEAETLYQKLYESSAEIAPSLIRYVDSDSYGDESLPEEFFHSFHPSFNLSNDNVMLTKVHPVSNIGEDIIIAAIIFDKKPQDFFSLLKKVGDMPPAEKEKLLNASLAGMSFYHKAPVYFEMVDCLVQTSLSACCFAQFKRHRIATLIRSDYHPSYGYVIPPSIDNQKLRDSFEQAMKMSGEMYERLEEVKRGLGNYILTNAHRRNVLMKTNLRELYHFSRLRSDKHAQWEIRNISKDIDKQLKKLFPAACSKIMGKSEFTC